MSDVCPSRAPPEQVQWRCTANLPLLTPVSGRNTHIANLKHQRMDGKGADISSVYHLSLLQAAQNTIRTSALEEACGVGGSAGNSRLTGART